MEKSDEPFLLDYQCSVFLGFGTPSPQNGGSSPATEISTYLSFIRYELKQTI